MSVRRRRYGAAAACDQDVIQSARDLRDACRGLDQELADDTAELLEEILEETLAELRGD